MKQARNLVLFVIVSSLGVFAQQGTPTPGNNDVGGRVGPANVGISQDTRLHNQTQDQGKPQQNQQTQQNSQNQQAQPATVPAGKRPPQAKTKEEYAAFTGLVQMTDPAAMEKAADDFVAKFPDSELKGAVYHQTMAAYQNGGNEEKTLDMGRKALTYNPDDPGVLVSVAEMIASRTRETDLDKDDRLAEATKDAKHALETVADYPAPPSMAPEQVAKIKEEIRSTAYSAMGMADYTNKNYDSAIANFKQAADLLKDNPDSTILLRLTLSYDKAGKYAEALDAANKTLAAPGAPPQVVQLATQEKARLQKLATAPKPAAGPAPSSPQPEPVKPN
ncbi:MAG TPA: tetratricopeptide repeat protein [Terriglobales bacterium]